MALLIREEEVPLLFPMSEAIDAVETGFRMLSQNRAANGPRQRPKAGSATLQVMSAAASGVGLGLKAYPVTKAGADFLVLLWNDETGELEALIEAATLGSIRTGAASGVATRYCARRDARRLGLFGSGYQAETQLEAICAVRPIEEVLVYSRTAARREQFAERVAPKISARVRAVSDPNEAAGCEVIVTITNATEPLFEGSRPAPGTHVNAAGSNRSIAREIDTALIRRCARIFVDDLVQARTECGDLIAAVAEGGTAWSAVRELSEVVGGTEAGRQREEELTLFESQGIGLEDVMAARRVYEAAKAAGAGESLPAIGRKR